MQVSVGLLAHRGMKQTLHGQGTGRLSPDEIDSKKLEVWENVNALLVDAKSKGGSVKGRAKAAPFWVLGGSEPTESDTTVYGFIASGLVCES